MPNHDTDTKPDSTPVKVRQPLRNDVPLRLPADLTDRAESIVPVVTKYLPDIKTVLGTVTRVAVLRLALGRGLDSIEAECKSKGWTPHADLPE